ncbi:hypothetical protein [Hymenobacter swuensis]|uniref:Resolvase HTH domain-containing protein n=1 Tax=Hymenobacter swuensis DY53 TaxID=1227739 RepID=W8F8P1_9BACT|nr:hypothetical protein [Hymenobacter swuensis]AHJ98971.1 hypothetical protein Hsw_3376 [Hymenobacter swuensis DY53]
MIEQIQQLQAEGLNMRKISAATLVSVGTVYKYMLKTEVIVA